MRGILSFKFKKREDNPSTTQIRNMRSETKQAICQKMKPQRPSEKKTPHQLGISTMLVLGRCLKLYMYLHKTGQCDFCVLLQSFINDRSHLSKLKSRMKITLSACRTNLRGQNYYFQVLE